MLIFFSGFSAWSPSPVNWSPCFTSLPSLVLRFGFVSHFLQQLNAEQLKPVQIRSAARAQWLKYRQRLIQHCRTSDLELTATCSVKLSLSLSLHLNPGLILICFLLLSVNCSTYLFLRRLCSRLMALWRFLNFVLLLLLLLLPYNVRIIRIRRWIRRLNFWLLVKGKL